jgi:sec-independent protein translocase protein TatA
MTHWLVVAIVVLLLFGRGKISELMGDVAKGIKSFKKGMAEDDEAAPQPAPRSIDHAAAPTAVPPPVGAAPDIKTERAESRL